MSEHIDIRRKLKAVPEIKTFEDLLSRCIITDEDKLFLRLHYLQGKDFRYIGDELGFSESAMKRRHKRLLIKLNKLL